MDTTQLERKKLQPSPGFNGTEVCASSTACALLNLGLSKELDASDLTLF